LRVADAAHFQQIVNRQRTLRRLRRDNNSGGAVERERKDENSDSGKTLHIILLEISDVWEEFPACGNLS
jgi:hypothetical protein